jgi:hypothetical protein
MRFTKIGMAVAGSTMAIGMFASMGMASAAAGASSKQPAQPAGNACVFLGKGVTVRDMYVGHVGWAFREQNGKWEYGANEGPINLSLDKPNLISNTWWKHDGKWDQVLTKFKGYLAYKCANVVPASKWRDGIRRPDPKSADKQVKREQGGVYLITTHDCLSQAYDVLHAYGATLPNRAQAAYLPLLWFNNLDARQHSLI